MKTKSRSAGERAKAKAKGKYKRVTGPRRVGDEICMRMNETQRIANEQLVRVDSTTRSGRSISGYGVEAAAGRMKLGPGSIAMCPQASILPPVDIGSYWTDEEIFKYLDEFEHGSDLPSNVMAELNPYQYMPSNLPDGIWYYVRIEDEKDTKFGFWKARGEATEIFSNTAVIGLRTTLEYYEGQVPHERRTDWVMQEYRTTKKELLDNGKPKDSRSLCRVFFTGENNPNHETVAKHGTRTPASGSETLENLNEHILTGDYLELNDLVDPESRSMSSDNSSCQTLTSEECFDSLALLQDIEDENNRKFKDNKFTVSTVTKPNEVIVPPSISGCVDMKGDESKLLPVERDSSASGSNKHGVVEEENKAQTSRKKRLKLKYFCFIAF